MQTLTEFFLNNKKFTLVLTLVVLAFGLGGLLRIKAESFPAVDFAMARVVTLYDGASAETVETKITKPIEDELRTISGIKDVRSVSQSGLSTIFIRGDIDNVDVPRLMADLQRAVDRAEMPTDLKDPPKFTEFKSEEFPVVEIAVVGDNTDRRRDKVADLLRDDIEDLTEIRSVQAVGYRERAFEITLDRRRLEKHHVGINEVLRALEERHVNTPGGVLKEGPSQVLLRVEGEVKSVDDLKSVLVRANAYGQKVYLRDVADLRDGQEEARILARHNQTPATLLIANKKAGADTIDLVEQIDKKLAHFRATYPDLAFEIYNNEALKVKNRVSVLISNAVSGFALVVLFLFLFLPGRVGLMASLSLPVALAATFGFMPVLGINLDAISVLALVIAIGMLVDNSVVMSENFARLRSTGLHVRPAILASVRTLALPISATVMTTVAAFLPMLATKGIMGEFIRYIPILVSLALLISLAESFIFLPMRLEGVSKVEHTMEADWFTRKIIPIFERHVAYLVRRRYLALLGFTGLLALCVAMMVVFNKFILFPSDQTEIYVARIEMPVGTRLETTDDVVAKLSKAYAQTMGDRVEHMVARSGLSSVESLDPKSKENNNVAIILFYVDEHTRNHVVDTEVLEQLRSIDVSSAEFRGAKVTYETVINGPPVGEPVEVTFRSSDAQHLDEVIRSVMAALEATPGVRDVAVQDTFGDDEIFVHLNYDKAEVLGFGVRSVGNAVRAAIGGKDVANVSLLNREVDLVVRLREDQRRNLEDLKNVKLSGREGYLVPLKAFAEFERSTGAPHIKRFGYKRSRTVTASIDDSRISSVEANQVLMKAYGELAQKYPDVSVVFGGEQENTKESLESLWNALVLSLLGIFALLVFVFRSYLRPAVIMSTIPLGLVGVSIAFAFHGRPISFLAMIGVIGLGGIIVNAGIVLISFIDELREGQGMPLEQALVKAAGMRLRSVCASSLTTISGLLPTAYGIGGTDAILVPMTLAMAWGLTSGTLLTLIWVPCGYAIIEDIAALPKKLFGKRSAV